MHWDVFTKTDALWWRRNAWSGYRRGEWIARIVGDWIAPLSPSGSRDPWRISRVDRRLYLSSFHLSPEAARSYLDVLERRRPEYLMGYPSSLEILAAYCLDAGRTLAWSPKRVWFSSEPMYEHQRELITRVFRAPIVGLFGSAERIVSAAECESGSYHLAMVDGFVEGQFGRLDPHEPARVTTLMNRVMPLIRFELGDIISVRPDAVCPCGRTLPVIEPVVTKHEDWVDTPSGRRVSPSALTWAFKDLRGVRRSQIVQISDRTVEVHVDADESAMDGITRLLGERLGELFFGEMDVTVVRDTEIRIMQSGKSRFVVRRPAAGRAAPRA
jgi:phenylacetate-CoA ligase